MVKLIAKTASAVASPFWFASCYLVLFFVFFYEEFIRCTTQSKLTLFYEFLWVTTSNNWARMKKSIITAAPSLWWRAMCRSNKLIKTHIFCNNIAIRTNFQKVHCITSPWVNLLVCYFLTQGDEEIDKWKLIVYNWIVLFKERNFCLNMSVPLHTLLYLSHIHRLSQVFTTG